MKLYSLIIFMILLACYFAAGQGVPQGINWQTVVRLPDGSLVQNQFVSVRFDIHQGTANGTVVYSETHADTADEFGLLNLNLGAGTAVSGQFDTIDWGNGPYFTEVLVDPAGGSDYLSTGAQQMMSVPYALYGEDADADPANEIQAISISNDTIYVTNGGFVVLPNSESDSINLNDLPTEGLNGQRLIYCNGKAVWSWTFACPCEDTLVDARDGQVYGIQQFGDQWWMCENLNFGLFITRTSSLHDQTNNSVAEKYCYDNNSSNCDIYGGLYQWNELMEYSSSSNSNPSGIQGLCPDGWHVPSDAEWIELENYLIANGYNYDGSAIGNKIAKSMASVTGWSSSTLQGVISNDRRLNNSSGFAGLSAGRSNTSTSFTNEGGEGHFWSATESGGRVWYRFLSHVEPGLGRNEQLKGFGHSCRCVQD